MISYDHGSLKQVKATIAGDRTSGRVVTIPFDALRSRFGPNVSRSSRYSSRHFLARGLNYNRRVWPHSSPGVRSSPRAISQPRALLLELFHGVTIEHHAAFRRAFTLADAPQTVQPLGLAVAPNPGPVEIRLAHAQSFSKRSGASSVPAMRSDLPTRAGIAAARRARSVSTRSCITRATVGRNPGCSSAAAQSVPSS